MKFVKESIKKLLRIFSVFVLFCVFFFTVTIGHSSDFSKFHTYNNITRELRDIEKRNKNIVRLKSIGETLEKRSIWVIEIANPEGVPVEERSALLIAANFEGDHLIGSEIALSIIHYLVNRYDSDDKVKEKIDNHVFYIIPRINPDAAELIFEKVKTGRKTNTKPYDEDNDGRNDEDGPEDLNRDGFITVMRVKDPEGNFIIDQDEPRLIKKADPKKGETGVYKLYWEGIDNDGDGFINEDPKGGVDINRNFQHEYPYYKHDAGWHMVSENESRALMDWIISHRNVAIILTFGESDNLIVAPDDSGKLAPSNEIELFNFADESNEKADTMGMFRSGTDSMQPQEQSQESGRLRPARQPTTSVDSTDIEYFKRISEKYKELTGITEQPPIRMPRGAFFEYGYYQYGVPSFSTPGWGLTESAVQDTSATEEKTESEDSSNKISINKKDNDETKKITLDKKLLEWMKSKDIDGFVDWTPYSHPEHGEVEIGGFKPYMVTNPPVDTITKLGVSHSEFVLYLTTLFPRIRIAKTEVSNHGGGIFRIKAQVENAGYLPTALGQGVRSRSVKPTMVQLEVDPKSIISGNNKTSFFQALNGSGNRQEFEWLIKAEPGTVIELRVVSQKGGTDKTSINLK